MSIVGLYLAIGTVLASSVLPFEQEKSPLGFTVNALAWPVLLVLLVPVVRRRPARR